MGEIDHDKLLAHAKKLDEECATWTDRQLRVTYSHKALTMEETYVSTDIESNGPIPGTYSMLSFASAAYKADGTLISTFEANLEFLGSDAAVHPPTMKFWSENPEAWKATRKNLQEPKAAMTTYCKWVDELPGKPVFVAYPAGFDFTFIYWYCMHFVDRCPFSFSALDMKTMAMCLLDKPFRKCNKRSFPARWFSPRKHTHVAIDDALEQGEMFCKMLKELKKMHDQPKETQPNG